MLGGILFYYRTLICVHFLLFSKCWFFMVFIAGVLISIFLPVSLCLNHWGKWDTARHDGIVPLPGNNENLNFETSVVQVERT